MKLRSFIISISTMILFAPVNAIADAQVHEWIGSYDMNHDEWVRTLTIADSKMDCAIWY